MEIQTWLSRHYEFISAENITIPSVSSDDILQAFLAVVEQQMWNYSSYSKNKNKKMKIEKNKNKNTNYLTIYIYIYIYIYFVMRFPLIFNGWGVWRQTFMGKENEELIKDIRRVLFQEKWWLTQLVVYLIYFFLFWWS